MAAGYLAVKLTALYEHGLQEYLDFYESVAARLCELPDFKLHAPHRASNPNDQSPDGLSPGDVYLLDRVQVAHSDVIVACLELASLGVGAELQMATDFGIPIVGFYYAQATRTPSRLVLGMPSIRLDDDLHRVVRYTPSPAGRMQLLEDLAAAVVASLADRRPRPTTASSQLARFMDRRRRELGLSCRDLAIASAVTVGTTHMLSLAGDAFAQWLGSTPVRRALSIDPREVNEDRVLLPSFHAIVRIARVLDIQADELLTPPAPAGVSGEIRSRSIS